MTIALKWGFGGMKQKLVSFIDKSVFLPAFGPVSAYVVLSLKSALRYWWVV
jgi:hypothetical protein